MNPTGFERSLLALVTLSETMTSLALGVCRSTNPSFLPSATALPSRLPLADPLRSKRTASAVETAGLEVAGSDACARYGQVRLGLHRSREGEV